VTALFRSPSILLSVPPTGWLLFLQYLPIRTVLALSRRFVERTYISRSKLSFQITAVLYLFKN